MKSNRHPRPWKIVKTQGGWRITDADGESVAWFGDEDIATHIVESVNKAAEEVK